MSKRLEVQINDVYLIVYDSNPEWTKDYQVFLYNDDLEVDIVPILSDDVIGAIDALVLGV